MDPTFLFKPLDELIILYVALQNRIPRSIHLCRIDSSQGRHAHGFPILQNLLTIQKGNTVQDFRSPPLSNSIKHFIGRIDDFFEFCP